MNIGELANRMSERDKRKNRGTKKKANKLSGLSVIGLGVVGRGLI